MRFALVLLSVLGVLTACTPGPAPVAAVGLTADGRVRLTYGLCEGERPNSASVSDQAGAAWTVLAPDAGAVAEITLLDQPPAWEATASDLTELASGRYDLEVTTDGYKGDRRREATLTFTLDRLRALPAGQVLAADAKGDATDLSRAEFERRAARAC